MTDLKSKAIRRDKDTGAYLIAAEDIEQAATDMAALRVERDRLRELVRSGDEHEEDCDYRNLSGDLQCNCAGGRARAALGEQS